MGIVSAMMQVGAAIKHAVVALFKVTHSLRFDGSGDYLEWTPTVARGSNWTFSVWFKRAATGTGGLWHPILEADNGASSDTIGVYDDELYIGWRSGQASATINDSFADTEWHHLVVTYTSGQSTLADTLKIYLDGTPKTISGYLFTRLLTTSDTLNFGTNVQNYIGGRTSGTSYWFNGQLAEIHFIDGTAYDETYFGETRNNQWVPKEVTGVTYGNNGFYLPFDRKPEGVALLVRGDTLTDLSGNHTLQAYGSTPLHNNTTQTKNASGSLYLDGTGDYVSLGTADPLGVTDQKWTIEAWVYPEEFANWQNIAAYGGGAATWNATNGHQWLFFYGQSLAYFQFYDGSSVTSLSTSHGLSLNTWHHLAVTRDGSTFRLFRDGTQIASITATPVKTTQSNFALIGCDPSLASTGFLQGHIEDLRITRGIARDIAAGFSSGTPITNGGWDVSLTNDYADYGSLGRDATTNSNNFAVNGNITPDDQLLDTPNLRFASFDPNNKGSAVTLSEANFKTAKSSSTFQGVRSVEAIPASSKIYAEYLLDDTPGAICGVGNASASVTTYVGVDANSWGWQPVSNPKVYHAGSNTLYGPTTVASDVVMIAVDRAAGKVYWGVNGEWITSSGTTTSFASALEGASDTDITNASSLYFMYSGQNNQNAIWNFGQDHTFSGALAPLSSPYTDGDLNGEFRYQPPSGFKALVTSY